MEKLRQRKIPLAIRGIEDVMNVTNLDLAEEINLLNSSNVILSCPRCGNNKFVRPCGSNKGMKKFCCENPDCDCNKFSTSTSFEAVELYRNKMCENLCLLLHTNSTYQGIALYNECSKYFVEYAIRGLYEFILKSTKKEGVEIKVNEEGDILLIFFDLSGSKVSKNRAIIFAKINDQIIFEIVTHSNTLSTHLILDSIKSKLKIPDGTQVVFVTDGEACFVDSVRHFFPNSIHIRQFHSKNAKGIIYIHLNYEGKIHTVKTNWDIVLNEDETSKEVLKQRNYVAKKNRERRKKEPKEKRYTELSKDVIIWEGTVYEPRGVRRLRQKKKTKEKKQDKKQKKTSTTDTPKQIFRGSLKEAKSNKIFKFCFEILKKTFGGLYITSNNIETEFNVKCKLTEHRSMKFGKEILTCILFLNIVHKGKGKREMMEYFRENVITRDFVFNKVLYGSGLQTKKKKKEKDYIEIIKNSIESEMELVIVYSDAFQNITTRRIEPIKIIENDYDSSILIESFCKLRNARRTFYIDRIRDLSVYNPCPFVFTKTY